MAKLREELARVLGGTKSTLVHEIKTARAPRESNTVANYQKAIVTFLDILGFRNLIAKATCGEINRKLNALNQFTRPIYLVGDDLDRELEPRFYSFSDCIVRVRSLETSANLQCPTGLLFYELLDLVFAQADLIRSGVLVRGGMAFGDVFASEEQVFGPTMVSAYELESKCALYPRIVLSPELLAELKRNPLLRSQGHAIEDECSFVSKMLRRGEEGLWFVDYARAVETEMDDVTKYPDFLKEHKATILKGAAEYGKEGVARIKYLWLAFYHNAIVGAKSDYWIRKTGLTRRQLVITSKDMTEFTSI